MLPLLRSFGLSSKDQYLYGMRIILVAISFNVIFNFAKSTLNIWKKISKRCRKNDFNKTKVHTENNPIKWFD